MTSKACMPNPHMEMCSPRSFVVSSALFVFFSILWLYLLNQTLKSLQILFFSFPPLFFYLLHPLHAVKHDLSLLLQSLNSFLFCKVSNTYTHRYTHAETPAHKTFTNPESCFQLFWSWRKTKGGLLRWSMGPWGWQRGHDCLLCQPSCSLKLHRNWTPPSHPQLTTRGERKREQYFNSLPLAIHHHPLTAIWAVKLSPSERKTGILQSNWRAKLDAGQHNFYLSYRKLNISNCTKSTLRFPAQDKFKPS